MGNFLSQSSQRIIPWRQIIPNIQNYTLIDIRKEYDFNQYNVPGSINMPHIQIQFQTILNSKKPVVLTCYKGISSLNEVQFLLSRGVDAYSAENGIEGYREYQRTNFL